MAHYDDRASLHAAFRDHVNPGKIDFFDFGGGPQM